MDYSLEHLMKLFTNIITNYVFPSLAQQSQTLSHSLHVVSSLYCSIALLTRTWAVQIHYTCVYFYNKSNTTTRNMNWDFKEIYKVT